MKDLEYHFGNKITDNVVFGFPSCVHLGDQVCFIQLIQNLNLKEFKINPTNEFGKNLCSYFFSNDIFSDSQPTHHFNASPDNLTEAYKCRYFKMNQLYISKNKFDYISYGFDCQYKKTEKTPKYVENLILNLQFRFGKQKIVRIGKHIGLDATIHIMNNSKVFIGVDNGLSHLCRSMNTPHILLEHEFSVSRGFPVEYCSYMKANSLQEVLSLTEKTCSE